MGDVDGGFVSGELLLRSDADNARSLPAKLEERLRSSLSGRAARRRAASSLRRIDVLRRAVRSRVSASSVACACARARGDFLVTHAARGERRGAREAARRERAYRRDLDAKLAALAVRYGAVLVAERRASAAREAEADCERRRALATLEARARLAAFGLHVEHETRGGVALRRLGPADAQWARCRRAAAENARRGFFGADWHFGGLEIVDVYKMENRALLDDFQSRSDALGKKFAEKSGDGDEKPKANLKQVKGLFCGVPSECVARPRPRRVRGGLADGAARAGRAALRLRAARRREPEQARARLLRRRAHLAERDARGARRAGPGVVVAGRLRRRGSGRRRRRRRALWRVEDCARQRRANVF